MRTPSPPSGAAAATPASAAAVLRTWRKIGASGEVASNEAVALKGDLQTLPLRDLLGWLAQREASGTLSLSRGMMARRFQLRRGRVMLSSSTDEEMLLGRLLIKRGLIDLAQLEAVLQSRRGSRMRLGAALTRAGLVTAAELRAVLTDKVRRLLLEALLWTDGGFFFDDLGPLPKRTGIAAVVRLAEILALPPAQAHAAAEIVDEATDVLITDADIIEIIELTKVQRPAAAPRAKRPKLRGTSPVIHAGAPAAASLQK